jgi:hypothetical protein
MYSEAVIQAGNSIVYSLVARETVILSEFAAGTGASAFVPKSYFCLDF